MLKSVIVGWGVISQQEELLAAQWSTSICNPVKSYTAAGPPIHADVLHLLWLSVNCTTSKVFKTAGTKFHQRIPIIPTLRNTSCYTLLPVQMPTQTNLSPLIFLPAPPILCCSCQPIPDCRNYGSRRKLALASESGDAPWQREWFPWEGNKNPNKFWLSLD